MLRGVLVLEHAQHERQRARRRAPPAATRRAPRTACGVVRAVEDVSGSSSISCRRPGTSAAAAACCDRLLAERDRRRRADRPPRRRARARSCAAGRRPGRAASPSRGAARRVARSARSRSPATRSATASACRRQVGAEHERRARPHDRELLLGDVRDRRPQPARVLEPDVGEHRHLRVDHAGGVVAAAEPGLDHRHLHLPLGHLPQRRRASAVRTASRGRPRRACG